MLYKEKNVALNYRSNKKRIVVISLLLFVVVGTIYLYLDYYGPSEIKLHADTVFGISCLTAHDLVVQEYDKKGNLWASRGMIVYQKKKGENIFKKKAHVPTGFTIFWLRNFSIIRKITIRPKCIEMVSTENGDICALSAGKMWLLRAGEKVFQETFQLSNYGAGNQGIRNDGIVVVNDSTIFFGEYFKNPNRKEVRIFKSKNNLSSWQEAYEFAPKDTRHIHAIQKDPYTNKLWVLTGDSNNESFIAWSDDEFKTLNTIGRGSQVWRATQLVFTENAIFWGTDCSDGNVMGIYRWDKQTEELEKIDDLVGTANYGTRLKGGTMVLGINSDNNKMSIDDKTRLIVLSENKLTVILCGTRNQFKLDWWEKKDALLRFQRDQGADALAITCLNQKELPDAELVIFSEKDLLKSTENR